MSVRADNRLVDAPMQPVGCHSCGANVLVRKSSWHQTTVQWSEQAMARCTSWDAGCPTVGRFPVCDELRSSIAQAAVECRIPVLEEDQ